MEPLPTSQKVMTWLCMCPAADGTSKTKRLCYAAFTLIVVKISFAALLTSLSFIIKNSSIDFEGSLYAVYQVAAQTAVLDVIIVGLINRQRITAIFTELSKLYTANQVDEISFRPIAEANNKSERLWKIYIEFGMFGFVVNVFITMTASIAYCFYNYGVFDVHHLYKPYKYVLPWNQYTLYGYFGEIIFSLFHGQSYMIVNGAVLILFTSICWHHDAFYKKFSGAIRQLEKYGNEHNANEIIRELYRFHVAVKGWFLDSATTYGSFVLVQLMCNVIFMAAVVFELDLRMKHIDFEFFLLLNALLVGVSNLYVYCYFGKLATECYEKMAVCLFESKWHELPLDVQTKILFLIKNTQKPLYYHGFGVVVLNLETFIQFIKTIFTYYMLFKTLTTK